MRTPRFAPAAALLLVVTVLFPSVASATTLTLDNTWVLLDDFNVGVNNTTPGWFTGTGSLTATAGVATTYEWDVPSWVRFEITDYLVVGDGFRIFDNGNPVGVFAGRPDWTAYCETKDESMSPSCHWTNNADVAWLDPVFNQGTLFFAPGPHALTIFDSHLPSLYNDGTVAFRATETTVPEPASMVLLGTGLLAAARRRMRRRD